jgi:hypothetical protein
MFLTNRVLPEHCRVSQRFPADDPCGQIRSGELLDEFTFSFTDRNLTELCLSAESPVSSQRRTHSAFAISYQSQNCW